MAADNSFDKNWYKEFSEIVQGNVDVYTYHAYTLGAGIKFEIFLVFSGFSVL